MNNLNSIIVEGNLVADPELSFTPAGTPVGKFRLACNRYYKQDGVRREEVSFLDIESWSRLAETCAEYLHKGRGVRVVGRIKQDRWDDPDGRHQSRVKIVAEHIEFKARPKVETPDLAAEVEAYKDETEPF